MFASRTKFKDCSALDNAAVTGSEMDEMAPFVMSYKDDAG
jgi:hypothetical protein